LGWDLLLLLPTCRCFQFSRLSRALESSPGGFSIPLMGSPTQEPSLFPRLWGAVPNEL